MPKTNIKNILKIKNGDSFTLEADLDEKKLKERFEKVRRLQKQSEERKKVNWEKLKTYRIG